MEALNFNNYNQHISGLSDFVINEPKGEIITGGEDFVLKTFKIETRENLSSVDIPDEIKSLALATINKIQVFAIGQGNSVQFFDNYDLIETGDVNSFLLTEFNSFVRKMLFNKKYNLLIAFSEDDDIHICHLDNKVVFKYKAAHEGSCKNMSLTSDEEYLITTGCDGYMTLSKIKDDGSLEVKMRTRIANKVTLENKIQLGIDCNSINTTTNSGLLGVSGGDSLRTIDLSLVNTEGFTWDKMKLQSQVEIFHKATMSTVQWFLNQYIMTVDINNVVKVWNYDTKVLQYQFDHTTAIIKIQYSKLNNFIVLNDFEGNLLISSNKFSFKTSNKPKLTKKEDDKHEDKHKHKEKEVTKSKHDGNVPDMADIDAFIMDCTNEISDKIGIDDKVKAVKETKETKGDKNDKDDNEDDEVKDVNGEKPDKRNLSNISRISDKNEDDNHDMLSLSQIEGDDGELKDRSEIAKNIEEKKQKKFTSLADKIIDCMPQKSFLPGSTNYASNSNSRFLCWNLIGSIVLREENEFQSIDVNFSNPNNKKKLVIVDTNNISMGVLNNCGAIFGSKGDEENYDEYEKDDKKLSTVLFKPIHAWTNLKEWQFTFGQGENVENLAIGVDWIAVYTDSFNMRIFNFSGLQQLIFSVPNQVLCMAGHENYLAYVYFSAPPLFGTQSMRMKILDSNQYFKEIYDNPLPISPYSTLTWFGYSEEGMLFSFDSDKIIRGFSFNLGNNWIPLLNLQEIYPDDNITFWILGVQDEELYGVELKHGLVEPLTHPRPPIKIHKFKIPLLSSKDNTFNKDTKDSNKDPETKLFEEKILRDLMFINHEIWRKNKYSAQKQVRSFQQPEQYYSESVKDDPEINDKKKEHDKYVLSTMKDCIVNGYPEKVLDLYNCLMLVKSKDLCQTLLQTLNHGKISEIIDSRKQIEQLKNDIELNHTLNVNETNIKNATILENLKLKESRNNLGDFAVNLDNLKSVEEEVKNIYNSRAEGRKKEDDETNNGGLNRFKFNTGGPTISLEKKNGMNNPFVKNNNDKKDVKTAKTNNIFNDLSQTQSAAQKEKGSEDSKDNISKQIGIKRKFEDGDKKVVQEVNKTKKIN